jgi:PAS domain S-box-containing protein
MNKYRIFIVEDETIVAHDLKETLINLGYIVVGTARSGEIALEKVVETNPDLVLMDIHLAGMMDGIQAAEEIHKTSNIPIIYFTAYADMKLLNRAKSTDPYGYIIKPYHERELQSVIEMALYKSSLDRKLKSSEERFRLLLQHVPSVSVQGYSMDGTIQYWNDASEHLYGYTAKEAIGKNLVDLIIPTEMQDDVRKAIALMVETGQPVPASELSLMRKDGSRVLVFSSHSIVKRSQGEIELFCIDIDLTDRKRAEDALHLANKKLKLLSSITRHDITNQLTVLVGYLHILENKRNDPSFGDYFRKVAFAAQRISTMIRFTKEYDSIGVNAPIWQDCRTLVDPVAKQASLGQIKVKNDFPSGAEVFADPLLVKVFYNLMDNAVRYGGNITTIRFAVEERDGHHVMVCEDDGAGVVARDKERIFDRGFGKNTGLGLALSREILAITGITIKETGEPGKGARFEMAVPKEAWRSVKKSQ